MGRGGGRTCICGIFRWSTPMQGMWSFAAVSVVSICSSCVCGALHSRLTLDRTRPGELHTVLVKGFFFLKGKHQCGSSIINLQSTANFHYCKLTTQTSHQSLNSLLMAQSLSVTICFNKYSSNLSVMWLSSITPKSTINYLLVTLCPWQSVFNNILVVLVSCDILLSHTL